MGEIKIHHRRSIRIQGYDYTRTGDYFVTIVTFHREPLFGRIVEGEMLLSTFGLIARSEWFKSARVRKYVELYENEFIVMPNHIHGIIHIVETDGTPNPTGAHPVGAQCHCAPTTGNHGFNVVPHSLGAIVRGYKSAVTHEINKIRKTQGEQIWQRNYYEHIITGDGENERIAFYIMNNPLNWGMDREATS